MVARGLVIGLALAVSSSQSLGAGTVSLLLGSETLDEGFWAPTDQPLSVGLAVHVPLSRSRAGLQLGGIMAWESTTAFLPAPVSDFGDIDLDMVEAFVGFGAVFPEPEPSTSHASFSVGASLCEVDYSITTTSGTVSASDDTTGFYLSIGGGQRYGKVELNGIVRFRLGTDLELFGVKGDIDSTSLHFSIGYSF